MEVKAAEHKALSAACEKAREAWIITERLGDAKETSKLRRKYNVAKEESVAAYIIVRDYLSEQSGIARAAERAEAQAKKSAAAKVKADFLQKRFSDATPAQQAYVCFIAGYMQIEKLMAVKQRSAATFIDAYKSRAVSGANVPFRGYVNFYELFMNNLAKEIAGGCTVFQAAEQMWSYE